MPDMLIGGGVDKKLMLVMLLSKQQQAAAGLRFSFIKYQHTAAARRLQILHF